MQTKKTLINAALALAAVLLAGSLSAQTSSINTFSPYSFYGLGDLSTQGPAYIRQMGGAGAAYRNPFVINYLNPASYSATLQKTALFNFGLEGGGYYLKEEASDGITRKSSYNTFNIRDIAIQFPLTKNWGFAISVTPYSNVGYRVQKIEIEKDLGIINYKYEGEGGLTQVKAGTGVEVAKGLSVGAEAIYYFGSIDRTFGTYITSITGSGTYSNVAPTYTENISRMFGGIGVQWDFIANTKRLMTLGATYQMGGKLNPTNKRTISSVTEENVASAESLGEDFKIPHSATLGTFYNTPKLSIGLDYSYQGWGANKSLLPDQMKYKDTLTVKLGGGYTPNRYDVRNAMNRVTYRFGVRYGDYYMKMNGKNISDKAITVGFGIPIRYSSINVGLEFGQRGSLSPGIIRENYFKVSLGFSFYDDYWFMKFKYD